MDEVRKILPGIREGDAEADVVDGGARGVYVRVNNEQGEAAALLHAEMRQFPPS
ncbi:hypothetical protein [Sphingomonas parva]|uniref:hypothetical protein n=1 Tax=Sphingomonas parva TaxID=2555898 RepID=UPI0014302577|nr:hypothetical protein [Sphingomonas parva]